MTHFHSLTIKEFTIIDLTIVTKPHTIHKSDSKFA